MLKLPCSFNRIFVILSLLSLGLVLRNITDSRKVLQSYQDSVTVKKSLSKQAIRRKPKEVVTLDGLRSKYGTPPQKKYELTRRIYGKDCILPAVSKGRWRQVPARDLEMIQARSQEVTTGCEMRGEALVFTLNLKKAAKAGGFAFEMPFPHYIVADEGGSWRRQRSTLQLFHVDQKGAFHPMGPAHSLHSDIGSKGNGAFSHWRHPLSNGPYGASSLRFSTPKNVPLAKLHGMVAVAFPMAPPMGWIEFTEGKTVMHEEMFREMFLQTFPVVGVARPHLIEKAADTVPGTRYLWRIGGNGEFQLPLKNGELYEKRLPYQIAEWYGEFEKRGGVLFPPPASYMFYQNKVGLANLFKESEVKTPKTWVISSYAEAEDAGDEIVFPAVIKDPYGFSSLGLLQAEDKSEFMKNIKRYFDDALPEVEAIVQTKVVALKEARVTYIDGRPFHGYWRIRQSLKSASAASNLGGYQDFNFPLKEIAPYIAEFAEKTGVPVGGVDFIWQDEHADVKSTPFTLEVSPTSDINPPAPASWTKTYAEFKHTSGYHRAYLDVRRQWTDLMAMAVIDRYRRERKHLFVDIDNVVSRSMTRVRRWRGGKEAYSAAEVMKDEPVEGSVQALKRLRSNYFIRFLTARGSYEDPFNVTQTWLELHGFEFDDLIVVDGPESKVAHMSPETVLVDDFTLGHEKEKPFMNEKFMTQLRDAGLPFVVFPLGGSWADVMDRLKPEENQRSAEQSSPDDGT